MTELSRWWGIAGVWEALRRPPAQCITRNTLLLIALSRHTSYIVFFEVAGSDGIGTRPHAIISWDRDCRDCTLTFSGSSWEAQTQLLKRRPKLTTVVGGLSSIDLPKARLLAYLSALTWPQDRVNLMGCIVIQVEIITSSGADTTWCCRTCRAGWLSAWLSNHRLLVKIASALEDGRKKSCLTPLFRGTFPGLKRKTESTSHSSAVQGNISWPNKP